MTSPDSTSGSSDRVAYDWPLILAAGVVPLLLGAVVMLRRPDLVFTVDFLTHDQGVQLLIGDRLASGAMLYRDLAYPYGPLPAYVLAAAALLGGLSAQVYLSLVCALGAAFLMVLTHALRQHVDRATAASVVLLGVLPLTATPGAVLGGYTNNSYIGLERMLLATLVLAWRPPDRRSAAASVWLGLIFGTWQLVKFGGAAFGIAAWLAVDALSFWRRPSSFSAVEYVRRLCLTLGVFGTIEACRWATLFAVLPRDVAWDVAWPAYTAQLYATLAEGASTVWPGSLTEFATQWLPVCAGIVLSVAAAVSMARRRCNERQVVLLLPAAFYVMANLGYLGHAHTVRQYVWTWIPAATLLLHRRQRALQLFAVCAVAPAVALALKIALVNQPLVGLQEARMPNGDRLWVDSARAVQLPRLLAEMTRPVPTFAMTAAGGLYFYADAQLPTRHPWLLPAYVRPYEAAVTSSALRESGELLILDETATTPEQAAALVDAVFGPGMFSTLETRGATLQGLAPNWWLLEAESAPAPSAAR